jgi:hypothetical protein
MRAKCVGSRAFLVDSSPRYQLVPARTNLYQLAPDGSYCLPIRLARSDIRAVRRYVPGNRWYGIAAPLMKKVTRDMDGFELDEKALLALEQGADAYFYSL